MGVLNQLIATITIWKVLLYILNCLFSCNRQNLVFKILCSCKNFIEVIFFPIVGFWRHFRIWVILTIYIFLLSLHIDFLLFFFIFLLLLLLLILIKLFQIIFVRFTLFTGIILVIIFIIHISLMPVLTLNLHVFLQIIR